MQLQLQIKNSISFNNHLEYIFINYNILKKATYQYLNLFYMLYTIGSFSYIKKYNINIFVHILGKKEYITIVLCINLNI